jgi:hypothetical protein
MKPPLHVPVADGAQLRQLEEALIRVRRRFRALLRVWLTLALVMVGIFFLVYVGGDGDDGPPVPLIVLLATAIAVAYRSARVLVTQPRMLAAQRELLGQRPAGTASGSAAGRRDATRSSIERLRRQIAALSPPRPELAEALEQAAEDAERRFREIAGAAVEAARSELGDSESRSLPRAAAGEERHARLECCRLALASLESDVLLDPGYLAGDEALAVLQRARTYLEANGRQGSL